MDAAGDPDPDPGGWPVHPAAAFYGLWPRFASDDEEANGAVAADSDPALAG